MGVAIFVTIENGDLKNDLCQKEYPFVITQITSKTCRQ
jgi:hypothetical protein